MGCCGSSTGTGTATIGAGAALVDDGKRVNYTKGMLLGVDDFVQEQAWHIARRHELAREVLGYGTVRGLKVAVDPGAPRVRVTPGMAWMPSGTPVCVPSEQCCDINAWLQKHWSTLPASVNGATQPAPLTVYVVLSHDSCLTDLLPVPGEPCRSEDELTAASRIADCFKLELRLQPPDQIEENAIRDFADWLARVPVDPSSPPLSEADFLAQLRDAALAWLEPSSPHPADFMFGSPPATLGSTDDLMRAALRLWVTELRPLWRARYGCGPNPSAPGGVDDAVLLAALNLQVHKADQTADADVDVAEDARPVLLSLRMVQELITQNPAPEPAHSVEPALDFGLSPATGSDTAYARADHQHGTPVLPLLAGEVTGPLTANSVTLLRGHAFTGAPGAGDVLALNTSALWEPRSLPQAATAVTAAQRFGLNPDPGAAATTRYAKADHTHGTPALNGDVAAVLNGAVQEMRVVGLQGRKVLATAPQNRQVLTFNGSDWAPADPAGSTGPAPGTTPPPGLSFGGTGVVGTGTAYALANHTHSLPAAPTLPAPGGDLSGTLDTATIASLQRQPLKATQPKKGDLLSFDGSAWVPSTGGAVIAVAGAVAFTLEKGQVSATAPPRVLRSFGNLSMGAADVSNRDNLIRVGLHAKPNITLPGKPQFILKITPNLSPGVLSSIFGSADLVALALARQPLTFTYAAGDVTPNPGTPGQFDFWVVLYCAVDLKTGVFDFSFQVEVTCFGA